MRKRRLLWVGDAGCDSGFARCTHETLKGFIGEWDIEVLGINYRGEPHEYPYPMRPACLMGSRGDILGVSRILDRCVRFRPDVVVLQNDPWNIPKYLDKLTPLGEHRPFLVGAIAVDAKNCRGQDLNGLDHAIFWTRFAEQEARAGGYVGMASVVPLGIDLDVFQPLAGDRKQLRATFLPPATLDAFLVLNANRNQPRKRLDLTIEYFAEWYHRDRPNAYLYLHVCPTGDVGWNIDQLAKYHGLKGRILLSQPGTFEGLSEAELVTTYQVCDAQISTTLGEGWGLTTMEGMACGIPQIVPDWSALGEWATAALRVPCRYTAAAPVINTVGGIPDKHAFLAALTRLYRYPQERAQLQHEGLELVRRPEYRWSNIATLFAQEVDRAFRRVTEGGGCSTQEAAPTPAALP